MWSINRHRYGAIRPSPPYEPNDLACINGTELAQRFLTANIARHVIGSDISDRTSVGWNTDASTVALVDAADANIGDHVMCITEAETKQNEESYMR